MALESVLINFLVVLTVIFFLPKIVNRYWKIPSPLVEIILGIILGLIFPHYFFIDDTVSVLATLGIITLFVYSGMEVDISFLNKNKSFLIENSIRHLMVLLFSAIIVHNAFALSYQVSFILAVALTTPSAGYILSSMNKNDKRRKIVEGKAIMGEVLGLLLLVVFIKLNTPLFLALTLLAIFLLIFALPIVLNWLYAKIFNKLIGTEFSFILVVALISAFFTEYLGLHFLVGAFIAGLVARSFVSKLKIDGRVNQSKKIANSFGFFAMTFIPFYFFSVGLNMKSEIFSFRSIGIALLLCFGISSLRILSLCMHRVWRKKEPLRRAFYYSYPIIPTVVFTFVIAQILLKNFGISPELYGTIMLYGIFTAITSLVLSYLDNRSRKKRKEV